MTEIQKELATEIRNALFREKIESAEDEAIKSAAAEITVGTLKGGSEPLIKILEELVVECSDTAFNAGLEIGIHIARIEKTARKFNLKM